MVDLDRPFNRRKFFKVVGAVAATTLPAACASRPAATPASPTETQPAAPPTNTPAPTEAPTATPIPEKPMVVNSATVKYGPDGIPVSITSNTGKDYPFDRQKMDEARELAKQTGETQIVSLDIVMNIVSPVDSKPVDPRERPPTKSLPTDTLNAEALKKRGITIIQKSPMLHLRSGAFNSGALLDQYSENDQNQLTIIVIDSPTMSVLALTDPVYDDVREAITSRLVPSTTERAERQEFLNRQLEQARAQLNQEAPDSANQRNLQNNILTYKIQLLLLDTEYGSVDTIQSIAAGYHFTKEHIVILGGGNKVRQTFCLSVDPDGHYSVDDIGAHTSFSELVPHAAHTHPSPSDFTELPTSHLNHPSAYKFGAEKFPIVAPHEFSHNRTETLAQQKIDALKLDMFNRGVEMFSDEERRINDQIVKLQQASSDEYATDNQAMQHIATGTQLWQESGFTDDTGFYFVFALPDQQGYILT